MNQEISNLADYIENTEDLSYAISELVLACWEDSDQEQTTLMGLLGAVTVAAHRILTYIGGGASDDEC